MKRGSSKSGKPKAGPGRIKRYGGAGKKVTVQGNTFNPSNAIASANAGLSTNTGNGSNAWAL